MRINTIIVLLAALLMAACSTHPTAPTVYTDVSTSAAMLPDYSDVTVPVNIAPLNFSVSDENVSECVAVFSAGAKQYAYGDGRKVIIDHDEWTELTSAASGGAIKVTLFTCRDDKWFRHRSFSIAVAKDSIDPYVAYRLIPPYNVYERISLCYRNLTSFEETEFYNNQMLDNQKGGHCINCHSFQNYRSDRMQFHVREEYGGTVIYDNGKFTKCNLKTDKTISSGVYPAWHPTLDLIAYSTNKSFLEAHTNGLCKSEVQDSESGLILYDVAHEHVIIVPRTGDDMMDTFPAWSPDGKWLYYCSAHFVFQEQESSAASDKARLNRQREVRERYRDLKYNIYRRAFNAAALTLGEPELVLDVVSEGRSASMPRVSPDGKNLLVSIGDYGNFHIYHPESDNYVCPLASLPATCVPLTAANSKRSADSSPRWSSNGRWIVFTSRRNDDNYTRLYFSYFDSKGIAHKAFEMPQADPDYELNNLCSYNVPEFTREPVKPTASQFADVVLGK